MIARGNRLSGAPSGLGSPSTPAAAVRLRDSARLRRYQRYQDFYEGRHFERARPGRTSLVLNYARAVVDKGVAYLLGRGVGFSVLPRREETAEERHQAEAAEQVLYEVYWDNDVEAVDLRVAQNAAVLGDGVYKVFWDTLDGRIRVLSVDPATFFATWAGDDPTELRRVEVAYRLGTEEAEGLVEALAPVGEALTPRPPLPRAGDRDDASRGVGETGQGVVEVVERWTADELAVYVGERVARRGPNPYGTIPFVHVPNLPLANEAWGVSDLVDVIPINREIDERVSDQADIIRFHADPPVIFKGVTDHSDLAVGPGTVWDLPSDADVKLLEWQGQPVAVQEHIERLYRTLYEVAETPRTAFGDSGRLLSGVALETELRPLVQRTMRKRVWWTRALRRRSALVLLLARRYGVGTRNEPRGAGREVAHLATPTSLLATRVRVVWPPMMPKDDAQEVRNNVQLVMAGLRSHRTAMDALGAESPEEEITRVLADRETLGEEQGARIKNQESRIKHQGGEGATRP